MNGTEWSERRRREIVRPCHAGLDSKTLKVRAMRNLKRVMPFDVAFFTTVDPATLLFTRAVVDNILARATPQFLENEFLQDDAVKFARLASGRSLVGALSIATRGELNRSMRYTEILAPLDLGDELR